MEITVKKLSKNKSQLEYKIPVYIKDVEKPATFLDVQIRYQRDTDYKFNKIYRLIKKSVYTYQERLAFRWKIGDINNTRSGLNGRYKINGIVPHFKSSSKVDDSTFDAVLTHFIVEDETFLAKMRSKKLNDILGEII